MNKDGQLILDRLERTTAHIAELLAASESEPPNLQASGELLAERGQLIAELTKVLEENNSLSFVEFNRLLTVHAQGCQIAFSFMGLRSALQNLALQAQRQRAYADRLQGMIHPSGIGCSEEA